MITIIVGTNREPSNSRQIATFVSTLFTRHDVAHQILDLSELPHDFTATALYTNAGKNDDFNELADKLRASTKYFFIIPEYNGSFPGVLKAFIDGQPYPSPWREKKAALLGLSSGVGGGGLALSHMTDILNYLGVHVLAQKPKLSKIDGNMEEGALTNDLYRSLIEEQVNAFLKF